MKVPIQYALTAPERLPLNGGRVDFPRLQSMTFLAPDRNRFRCLQLAYDALALGGTAPAVMNAANEIAVEAFLGNAISFDRIPALIAGTLESQKIVARPELEDTIEADRAARAFARTLL
jgi:1-deoxy-D-xylulose-5-phosphate reductoisomerase